MTEKEFFDLLTVVVWPIAAAALLIGGAGFLGIVIARWRARDPFRGAGAFLTAFTVLGLVVGFAAGHSREAALGAVLPALLTLISGVLTYALTKEGLAPFRSVLPHCITILAIASLVGLSIGGTVRKRFTAYERLIAERQARLEKVTWECEKAKYLAELEIYKAAKLAEIAAEAETTQDSMIRRSIP